MLRAFFSFAMMIACLPSNAGEAAGTAHYIRLDVKAFADGSSRAVDRGDFVFRNDIVRTAAESSAVLDLNNKSTLSMGPLSQVKIDGFTMGEDGRPRFVELLRGAFRFMSSSHGTSRGYDVKTPHATISVRGTTFDVRVQGATTTIVLHQGSVTVCKAQCREMQPGTTLEASAKSLGAVVNIGPSHWTFNDMHHQFGDPIMPKPSRRTNFTTDTTMRQQGPVEPRFEEINPPAKQGRVAISPSAAKQGQTVQQAPGWVSIHGQQQ